MSLKPVLGPVQLAFYGVGVIVGAGIYSVIGTAAGLAQDQLWLSFAIGAGVAMLTALSYAELATAFPQAGAEYNYVRRAWPHWPGLSFGIGILLLIGGAATAATVAESFGGYLKAFVDIPPLWSALAFLAVCTAFNIWGMRESSFANILFTSIEVAGLLLVVAAALASETTVPPPPSVAAEPAVIAAAALLFFVYLGFEVIANMVEEVRRPARDLPIALLGSIGITTVLYIMVSLAVMHIASPAALAESNAPLADAVRAVWPGLGNVLGAIALFATANTVLISVIATSRLTYAMARDGEIHRTLAGVLTRRQTPWAAALLVMLLAAALVPIGNVKILAQMSSFTALLAFLVVNVAMIVLRYRQPHHERPFLVPGAIGRMPVLPLIAIAAILVLLGYFDWPIYAVGAAALGMTAVAYLVRGWATRRR